jgi:S-layer protein
MAIISPAQQTAITNLYTALFNRAPDAAGFDFWAQALANGASLSTITASFLFSPESTSIYPVSQTPEQFVTTFYQTVFGRAPDASGLAFWTAALNAAGGMNSIAGKVSIVSKIVEIVSTPLTAKPADLTDAQYAETLADRATFANKVSVGVYFAVEKQGTNVDMAKKALAGVNANASSVDAAKSIISTPAAGGPGAAPARKIVGTDAADTFDLAHYDIAAGDSVDGGAGTDTLNYVDTSTTSAAFPVATVRNVEIINIRNLNTAGLSSESVLFQVWGSLASGQTLSIGGITVTANGVATSAQVSQAVLTGATVGNAVISGALTGYTASAVIPGGTSLALTSTIRGNVPDLTLSGTGTASASIMIAQGMNGVIDTVAADRFEGATTFNSDRSAAGVTFTGLAAGQTVGLIGNNASSTGTLSATYADNVTTATVNVSGGTKNGGISLTGAGVTSVIINSTGAANTNSSLILPGTTTALQINAAVDLSVSSVFSLGGGNLRTITASGNAATVALGTVSSPALISIDMSGLTAGGGAATIGAAPAATYLGGAGKDVVTIAANAVITGTVNGAAGSNDVIAFGTSNSLTSATAALISNFEVLKVSAANSAQVYDSTLIAGITKYQVGMSFYDVTLTTLSASADVTITGNTQNVVLSLLAVGGNTDNVNVTLEPDSANIGGPNLGVSVGALKIAGVETLNLHSRGLLVGALTSHAVTNDVGNTVLSKVSIDGDQALIFTVGTLSNAVDLAIDASAATGRLTIDGAAAVKRLDIKSGTSSDTIITGTGGATVAGGAGGDAITLGTGVDTVAYKAAGNSIQDFANVAGTAAGKMDAITGFSSGTDKIDLSSLGFLNDAQAFVSKTFASVDALVAAEAQASFYDDAGLTRGAVAAYVGADTYVVVDVDHNGLFNAANDLVVKLAGVTALQQADVAFIAAA